MKYQLLTKEQFEALHQEFAKYLASQKIDKKEWEEIKNKKPKLAQEELEIFSDMIWEDVLSKVEYLEHFSKHSINLFWCEQERISRILVKVNNNVNLLEKEGFQWLTRNFKDKSVEYFKASKAYTSERNSEIFDLIQKGSVISKGELFKAVGELVS